MKSQKLIQYFETINTKVKQAYESCQRARSKGFDPAPEVEIPLAQDMAERVEGLISVLEPRIKGAGIPKRIQELEEEHGKLSWKVAFVVSLEVAKQKFCSFESEHKAMEVGIRVGLAYLTLGVVASPLEGFVELKLKKRNDNGKEFFCLQFSGPIRSAGGTAAAVSVLVADYIRKQMGYAEYDPTETEIKRSVTELYDYHDRITNLQYLPSEEEVEFYAKHIPLQIAGDSSEKIEVSNYKDLARVETNLIRSGFCLVMGECLCQKAAKIQKQLAQWGKDFDMQQWEFLGDFVKLQKQKKARTQTKSESKISPDYTYIKDLVAGRPILGFPLRNGGFRLRYGRCRNTGLSSAAINPAAMYLLDKYIAVGTQLKLERPGKATSLSSCTSIEGPLVELESGEVLRVNTFSEAKRVYKEVKAILYLGDILINYGDFFNRAHPLVPAGYCEEWWLLECQKSAGVNNSSELAEKLSVSLTDFAEHDSPITLDTALHISKTLSVPLHPKFTYYWHSITHEQRVSLIHFLQTMKKEEAEGKVTKVILPLNEQFKQSLSLLGVPHTQSTEHLIISTDHAQLLTLCADFIPTEEILESLSKHLGVTVRDRCGTFIGSRMGRPEKAKVRKMDGQPHCLFPVGEEGGRLRSFQAALDKGYITSDFPLFSTADGRESVFGVDEKTGAQNTKKTYTSQNTYTGKREEKSYSHRSIPITEIYSDVLKTLDVAAGPDLVKGVRGTSNKDHVLEHLGKGILRATYNVPVNKDGTTRYDMTQLAITHFTPKEINTSVEKLISIGYTHDTYGKELTSEDQILELLPQDLILPQAQGSPEDGADLVLSRVAKFIDALLKKLYGEKPIYNVKNAEDLVGELVIALAPHTSAGIIGRIIGFSQTQGFYAHPMFHAATRRDCDGDEACVTLLSDALLNFSPQYLPNTRGATQDAPLVLTSHLNPAEVDDMVFDMDVCERYPLELYEAALNYTPPWEITIDQINGRLNTEKQYEGMLFTHHTETINAGVLCSAYKLLPTMQEKLYGQMDIALKVRAVSEADVAKIVIEKHFIRDIKGNLRKFSQQQFRCVDCNEKYRRPPLLGKCTKCGGKLLFTISEGSIVKYLEPALSLAHHYDLPPYLQQSLEVTKRRIEGIFGKDPEKQEALNKWFG